MDGEPKALEWPSFLEEFTNTIEERHKKGEVTDAMLMLFGMTFVWEATKNMSVPDRRRAITQFLEEIEQAEGVANAANDTGPVQPGGKTA